MVKNPLANAGDMGSNPGPVTKIPGALGQLNSHFDVRAHILQSPHAAITKPECHNKRSHHKEKPAYCN